MLEEGFLKHRKMFLGVCKNKRCLLLHMLQKHLHTQGEEGSGSTGDVGMLYVFRAGLGLGLKHKHKTTPNTKDT